MNKITKLIMGVMIITTSFAGAQNAKIDRVSNGAGIMSYANRESKVWTNTLTGTNYTLAIFADSLSATKTQFVLYVRADKPLRGFKCLFGFNGEGYSMKPTLDFNNEGQEFYTILTQETSNMFNSDKFEGLYIVAEIEVSGNELLAYGSYFKEFITTVRNRKF